MKIFLPDGTALDTSVTLNMAYGTDSLLFYNAAGSLVSTVSCVDAYEQMRFAEVVLSGLKNGLDSVELKTQAVATLSTLDPNTATAGVSTRALITGTGFKRGCSVDLLVHGGSTTYPVAISQRVGQVQLLVVLPGVVAETYDLVYTDYAGVVTKASALTVS